MKADKKSFLEGLDATQRDEIYKTNRPQYYIVGLFGYAFCV